MNEVFIALGSNLSQPLQQLKIAYQFLQQLDHQNATICSTIYRSAPMGPANQPDFFNAVCKITTSLTPMELLKQLQLQEQRQYRIKTQRWGARTIDLDILLFSQLCLHHEHLTIPHVGLTQRLFVLMPLAEIAENYRLPNQQTVQQALQHLLMQSDRYTIPIQQPFTIYDV